MSERYKDTIIKEIPVFGAPVVGVKYCGGCNCQYDRSRLFAMIKASNESTLFEAVREGACYDEIIVLCGCSRACACCSGIRYGKAYWITGDIS